MPRDAAPSSRRRCASRSSGVTSTTRAGRAGELDWIWSILPPMRGRALRRASWLCVLAALVVAAASAGCGGGGSSASGRLVLALDFTPNPAHAPIYLATREGFDRRHGVRLAIRRPGPGPDALKLLALG